MDAPRRKPARPEQEMQRGVFRALDQLAALRPVFAFHVPNAGQQRGRKGMIVGAILKGAGLKAGVADIAVLLPGGRVGFIELKTPEGRPTEAQRGFADICQRLGIPWRLSRTERDAVDTVLRWLDEAARGTLGTRPDVTEQARSEAREAA